MKNNMRIQQIIVVSLLLPISFALAMDKQLDKDIGEKDTKSVSGLENANEQVTKAGVILRKPERQYGQVFLSYESAHSGDKSPMSTVKFAEHMPEVPAESAVQKKRSQLTSLQSIGARVYLKSTLGQLKEAQEEEQQIKQVMRELRAQARKVGTVQENVAPEPVVIRSVEEGLDYLARRFGLEFVDYENAQPPATLAESQEHVLAFEPPYIQTDYVASYEHRPSPVLVLPQESIPLYKAIASGDAQTLATYLKEVQDGGGDLKTLGDGLDVDQQGFAPLNWVLIPHLDITVETRIAMLDMLLKAGCNIHRPSNSGRTAVHDAILSPLPEARQLFEFLYEKYVLSDLIDYEGQTPLHAAVAQGLVEPVTFLLGRKPDLEVRDFKERTPLQLAFESDLSSDVKAKIVNALVAAGADVNVCDTNNTPLIFQVIKKVDLTGVQLLLYHGVDIHKEDWKYGSMLKYAQQKVESTKNPEVAKKILALVTEYSEKKGITKHCVTIPIPENLQGEIDPAVLQRTVATMLTIPRLDNNKSLLQMAFEASLIKQQVKQQGK